MTDTLTTVEIDRMYNWLRDHEPGDGVVLGLDRYPGVLKVRLRRGARLAVAVIEEALTRGELLGRVAEAKRELSMAGASA